MWLNGFKFSNGAPGAEATGSNLYGLCRRERITPRSCGVKGGSGGNVCPGRATAGFALRYKVYPFAYLVRNPANARLSPSRAPCIGPPSNLVRSEEAAIRWGGECRGKPGPFVPGLPIRSGRGCALPSRDGTGLPAQRGPRSRGSPGAPSATRLGGHVVSPAPSCPDFPSAQAAAAPCLRGTARAYPPSGRGPQLAWAVMRNFRPIQVVCRGFQRPPRRSWPRS